MAKAKKEFDLSSMIDAVSNLDTAAAPQIQMIPVEDILPNRDNFYKLRDMEPLMDSIAMHGLLDPLILTPMPGKDGKYKIISGHRRRDAIHRLVHDKDHPREALRLVPCIVREYASPAMAELQLILANSTTRVLTNAEISKQAEKMEILLYQLKEEGYQFPGRMRDQVAAACKVSGPKLARLKVIREKLISDFMYYWEKEKLPEQTAYALARLPVEFQSRLSKITGGDVDKLKGGYVEKILENYNFGWRWEPTMTCPDGKTCPGGDRFLRHDLEHGYNMCGGEKCCLTCDRAKDTYSPCDRMCSRAQGRRKEKRDTAKEAADALVKRNAKKYQEETQKNAQRLLKAIDASGLPDNSSFEWDYYRRIKVSQVRQWAAGSFDEAADKWCQAQLVPGRLNNPTALAQLFGCSTDFLLGLTDEVTRPELSEAAREQMPKTDFLSGEPLEPEEDEDDDVDPVDEIKPRWLAGLPEKSGPVAVRVIDSAGDEDLDIYWYKADLRQFHYYKDIKLEVSGNVLGWWPVPEDPAEDET